MNFDLNHLFHWLSPVTYVFGMIRAKSCSRQDRANFPLLFETQVDIPESVRPLTSGISRIVCRPERHL